MTHECAICFSNDGKTETELAEGVVFNRKTHNYPIISLKQAYNCECKNTFAHNKCLLNIKKCPTCRKIVPKPNLYVKTWYDYIFYFIFNHIKTNPTIINCNKTICILILFAQLYTGVTYLMEDYFKKYWLYNERTMKIDSL